MPAPWGLQAPVFPVGRVRNVGDRAVTLRQLRELRSFTQRLCKAGLLTFPDSWPYNSDGRAGRRVEWAGLTQYEISSQVIRKVIPKEKGLSCSWAELVSGGTPQRRRFFCSHFWGEAFRDFIATIEDHAREFEVSEFDGYWICVYGNNQWDIDLGRTLAGSPFYQALQGADATVVFLDRGAQALQRLWCLFEMHETAVTLGQPLQLWTPLGRAGRGLVASGPVVQALRALDASQAVASDSFDQRRIRNHIAGEDEMAGIEMHGDRYVLRPHYELASVNGISRPYEEGLMEASSEKFRTLEERVYNGALDSLAGPGVGSSSGCQIPEVSQRGVTLAQLRAFAVEVRELLSKDQLPTGASWETMDFQQLRRCVVEPRTKSMKCSYVELVAPAAQQPSYSVSMWWGLPFKQFMEALEWHAEARKLPDSTAYWISLFAFNFSQAREESTTPAQRVQDMCYYTVINEGAGSVDGVLMVLDKEVVIASRLWPMLEAFLGIKHGKSFDLATWSGALATTQTFPGGAWATGAFDTAVASHILEFDVLHCRTVVEANRHMILRFIAGSGDGEEPPESCEAYDTFSQRFRCKCAGPVLRDAAVAGDLARIDWVIEACPGLSLEEPGLRGELGETALHLAAAAGQVPALQRLLRLRADVNACDLQRETPLHYAALAGQLGATRVLLRRGAELGATSLQGETCLEVARQNPAYFLGVQASVVAGFLCGENLEECEEEEEEPPPLPLPPKPELPDIEEEFDEPEAKRAPEVPAKRELPGLEDSAVEPEAKQALEAARASERQRRELAWAHFSPEEEEVEQLMAKLATTTKPMRRRMGSESQRRQNSIDVDGRIGEVRFSALEEENDLNVFADLGVFAEEPAAASGYASFADEEGDGWVNEAPQLDGTYGDLSEINEGVRASEAALDASRQSFVVPASVAASSIEEDSFVGTAVEADSEVGSLRGEEETPATRLPESTAEASSEFWMESSGRAEELEASEEETGASTVRREEEERERSTDGKDTKGKGGLYDTSSSDSERETPKKKLVQFRLEEEKRLSEEIAQKLADRKRLLEERRQIKREKEAEARAAEKEEARARIEMRRRKKEEMALLKADEERRRDREEARLIEEARRKREEEARRRQEEEESMRKAREERRQREEEEEDERRREEQERFEEEEARRREEQEETMRKWEEVRARDARRKEKKDRLRVQESAEHRAVEAIRKAEKRRDRSSGAFERVPSLKERLSMSAAKRQEAVRRLRESQEMEEAFSGDLSASGSALNAVRAASKTSEAPTVPIIEPDPPHWRLFEIVKQWGEKRGGFNVSFQHFRALFESLACFGDHIDRVIQAYFEDRHIVMHEELQVDIQDFMEWLCHRAN